MRHRPTASKSPPHPNKAGSRATDIVPLALAECLLTVAEAARMLRVSRNTVYNLIRCGDLRGVQVKGMQRIVGREVARYVQRHSGRVRRWRARGAPARRG